MIVFPLVYPINNPNGDPDEAFEVGHFISILAKSLAEATLCLHLFAQAQKSDWVSRSIDDWDRKRLLHRAADETILAERGLTHSELFLNNSESIEEIRVKAELQVVSDEFSAGRPLTGFEEVRALVHARSFVFALDRIRKILVALQKFKLSNDSATKALSHFDAALPDLKDLRDSTTHMDERARGEAYGKKIALKPVDMRSIQAGGGSGSFQGVGNALLFDSLDNDVFIATVADGRLGRISISGDSAAAAQQAIQLFVDNLSWDRPHRTVSPRV